MKKKTVYRVFLWGLTVGIAGMIFWLSHQTAEQSSALSGGVTEWLLSSLFAFLKLNEAQQDVLHAVVRAVAHVATFWLLGIGTSLLTRSYELKRWILVTVASCGGYALLDECHQQWFSAGRTFQTVDIAKDILGVALGVAVVALCAALRNRKQQKGK